MSKKDQCPICQVLRGKAPEGKTLCPDCSNNQKLKDAWGGYQIVTMITQTNWTYRFLFPVLLVLGHIVVWKNRDVSEGLNFGVFSSAIVAWGVWLVNLLYIWPKCNLRMSDLVGKKEEARSKMFVLKVAGDTASGDRF